MFSYHTLATAKLQPNLYKAIHVQQHQPRQPTLLAQISSTTGVSTRSLQDLQLLSQVKSTHLTDYALSTTPVTQVSNSPPMYSDDVVSSDTAATSGTAGSTSSAQAAESHQPQPTTRLSYSQLRKQITSDEVRQQPAFAAFQAKLKQRRQAIAHQVATSNFAHPVVGSPAGLVLPVQYNLRLWRYDEGSQTVGVKPRTDINVLTEPLEEPRAPPLKVFVAQADGLTTNYTIDADAEAQRWKEHWHNALSRIGDDGERLCQYFSKVDEVLDGYLRKTMGFSEVLVVKQRRLQILLHLIIKVSKPTTDASGVWTAQLLQESHYQRGKSWRHLPLFQRLFQKWQALALELAGFRATAMLQRAGANNVFDSAPPAAALYQLRSSLIHSDLEGDANTYWGTRICGQPLFRLLCCVGNLWHNLEDLSVVQTEILRLLPQEQLTNHWELRPKKAKFKTFSYETAAASELAELLTKKPWKLELRRHHHNGSLLAQQQDLTPASPAERLYLKKAYFWASYPWGMQGRHPRKDHLFTYCEDGWHSVNRRPTKAPDSERLYYRNLKASGQSRKISKNHVRRLTAKEKRQQQRLRAGAPRTSQRPRGTNSGAAAVAASREQLLAEWRQKNAEVVENLSRVNKREFLSSLTEQLHVLENLYRRYDESGEVVAAFSKVNRELRAVHKRINSTVRKVVSQKDSHRLVDAKLFEYCWLYEYAEETQEVYIKSEPIARSRPTTETKQSSASLSKGDLLKQLDSLWLLGYLDWVQEVEELNKAANLRLEEEDLALSFSSDSARWEWRARTPEEQRHWKEQLGDECPCHPYEVTFEEGSTSKMQCMSTILTHRCADPALQKLVADVMSDKDELTGTVWDVDVAETYKANVCGFLRHYKLEELRNSEFVKNQEGQYLTSYNPNDPESLTALRSDFLLQIEAFRRALVFRAGEIVYEKCRQKVAALDGVLQKFLKSLIINTVVETVPAAKEKCRVHLDGLSLVWSRRDPEDRSWFPGLELAANAEKLAKGSASEVKPVVLNFITAIFWKLIDPVDRKTSRTAALPDLTSEEQDRRDLGYCCTCQSDHLGSSKKCAHKSIQDIEEASAIDLQVRQATALRYCELIDDEDEHAEKVLQSPFGKNMLDADGKLLSCQLFCRRENEGEGADAKRRLLVDCTPLKNVMTMKKSIRDPLMANFEEERVFSKSPEAIIDMVCQKYRRIARRDLENAFYQVEIPEDFSHLFLFRWRGKLYRMKRMFHGWQYTGEALHLLQMFCIRVADILFHQLPLSGGQMSHVARTHEPEEWLTKLCALDYEVEAIPSNRTSKTKGYGELVKTIASWEGTHQNTVDVIYKALQNIRKEALESDEEYVDRLTAPLHCRLGHAVYGKANLSREKGLLALHKAVDDVHVGSTFGVIGTLYDACLGLTYAKCKLKVNESKSSVQTDEALNIPLQKNVKGTLSAKLPRRQLKDLESYLRALKKEVVQPLYFQPTTTRAAERRLEWEGKAAVFRYLRSLMNEDVRNQWNSIRMAMEFCVSSKALYRSINLQRYDHIRKDVIEASWADEGRWRSTCLSAIQEALKYVKDLKELVVTAKEEKSKAVPPEAVLVCTDASDVGLGIYIPERFTPGSTSETLMKQAVVRGRWAANELEALCMLLQEESSGCSLPVDLYQATKKLWHYVSEDVGEYVNNVRGDGHPLQRDLAASEEWDRLWEDLERLRTGWDIFAKEVLAALMGIFSMLPHKNIVLCVDAAAVVEIWKHPESTGHPIKRLVVGFKERLLREGVDVLIQWIPSGANKADIPSRICKTMFWTSSIQILVNNQMQLPCRAYRYGSEVVGELRSRNKQMVLDLEQTAMASASKALGLLNTTYFSRWTRLSDSKHERNAYERKIAKTFKYVFGEVIKARRKLVEHEEGLAEAIAQEQMQFWKAVVAATHAPAGNVGEAEEQESGRGGRFDRFCQLWKQEKQKTSEDRFLWSLEEWQARAATGRAGVLLLLWPAELALGQRYTSENPVALEEEQKRVAALCHQTQKCFRNLASDYEMAEEVEGILLEVQANKMKSEMEMQLQALNLRRKRRAILTFQGGYAIKPRMLSLKQAVAPKFFQVAADLMQQTRALQESVVLGQPRDPKAQCLLYLWEGDVYQVGGSTAEILIMLLAGSNEVEVERLFQHVGVNVEVVDGEGRCQKSGSDIWTLLLQHHAYRTWASAEHNEELLGRLKAAMMAVQRYQVYNEEWPRVAVGACKLFLKYYATHLNMALVLQSLAEEAGKEGDGRIYRNGFGFTMSTQEYMNFFDAIAEVDEEVRGRGLPEPINLRHGMSERRDIMWQIAEAASQRHHSQIYDSGGRLQSFELDPEEVVDEALRSHSELTRRFWVEQTPLWKVRQTSLLEEVMRTFIRARQNWHNTRGKWGLRHFGGQVLATDKDGGVILNNPNAIMMRLLTQAVQKAVQAAITARAKNEEVRQSQLEQLMQADRERWEQSKLVTEGQLAWRISEDLNPLAKEFGAGPGGGEAELTLEVRRRLVAEGNVEALIAALAVVYDADLREYRLGKARHSKWRTIGERELYQLRREELMGFGTSESDSNNDGVITLAANTNVAGEVEVGLSQMLGQVGNKTGAQ